MLLPPRKTASPPYVRRLGFSRDSNHCDLIFHVYPLFHRLTILFKIITRIKLLFSNYLGRYSYSFRARQELISVTVTASWV